MPRYEVEKRDNHWIVSANGNAVMRFKDKRLARQMVRIANEHLRSELVVDPEETERRRPESTKAVPVRFESVGFPRG